MHIQVARRRPLGSTWTNQDVFVLVPCTDDFFVFGSLGICCTDANHLISCELADVGKLGKLEVQSIHPRLCSSSVNTLSQISTLVRRTISNNFRVIMA